jgi:hypothetical protein
LREKRENGQIPVKKIDDFSVNGFLLMEKVYKRCFFPLNLHEMIDLNPKMFLITG